MKKSDRKKQEARILSKLIEEAEKIEWLYGKGNIKVLQK